MSRPVQRRLLPFLLLAGVVAALGASSRTHAQSSVVAAGAYGIAVLVPGQSGASAAVSGVLGGGPTGAAGGFAYPADGTAARTGALSSSAATDATGTVGSHAVADASGISFLNGEITADGVAARANATTDGADVNGSQVANLVVLGTPVSAGPNARFPLGDWGYAVTLEQVRRHRSSTAPSMRGPPSRGCTSCSRQTTAACPPGRRSSSAARKRRRRPRSPRRRRRSRHDDDRETRGAAAEGEAPGEAEASAQAPRAGA